MIPVMSFEGNRVAVLGLGRTGISAARALIEGGALVWAWDDSADRRAAAEAAGISLHDLYGVDFHQLTALVLSPGVPFTHPEPHVLVRRASNAGCDVIGDMELFARAMPRGQSARVVAVTGTNGKSTTTALIGHLLEHAGRHAAVGGNIGRPVLDLPTLDRDGFYVFEMSSYQIDLTRSLVADVAILLNVSPDHLDRHGSMDGYVAVKRRIFEGQSERDTAIIGVDDRYCREIFDALAMQGMQRVVPVSVGSVIPGGVCVMNGRLLDATGEATETVADLTGLATLPGVHNWQNAAAAYAAGRSLGINGAALVEALSTFPGLAHRMERVGRVKNVDYVNDSKATNAAAAARAIACFDQVFLILGGIAKEGGIESLRPLFPRIAKAYLIGEAAPAFAETLDGSVPYVEAGDLGSAVELATYDAMSTGVPAVVLFSPACASFDQFADFEARGDAFREHVAEIEARVGK